MAGPATMARRPERERAMLRLLYLVAQVESKRDTFRYTNVAVVLVMTAVLVLVAVLAVDCIVAVPASRRSAM